MYVTSISMINSFVKVKVGDDLLYKSKSILIFYEANFVARKTRISLVSEEKEVGYQTNVYDFTKWALLEKKAAWHNFDALTSYKDAK